MSNHQGLEEINNYAFRNAPLYELIIENSPNLKLIRYYQVFYSPETLRKVRFKNLKSFEWIGSDNFNYCKKLTEVEFNNLPSFKNMVGHSFTNSPIDKLVIKALPNFKSIGRNCFSNIDITSLSFEGMPNLNKIDYMSFSNNKYLKEVNFEGSYPSIIGEGTFSNCDIDIINFGHTENKLDIPLEIKRDAFKNNKIIKLELPKRYVR